MLLLLSLLAAAAPLQIEVPVRSARGALVVRVYQGAEGFLSAQAALREVRLPIEGPVVRWSAELPPGSYALTVWHDEDGDGVMALHWYGLPAEGVGVSLNPRPRFGPPRYQDAEILLTGAGRGERIELAY
ncbi:MAG: DUF2141 domain-containing protein [Deltaproteobacteria bacterium]|nr:DUF2141 domain-containing protein [Deltaproteobacteria bacterium]